MEVQTLAFVLFGFFLFFFLFLCFLFFSLLPESLRPSVATLLRSLEEFESAAQILIAVSGNSNSLSHVPFSSHELSLTIVVNISHFLLIPPGRFHEFPPTTITGPINRQMHIAKCLNCIHVLISVHDNREVIRQTRYATKKPKHDYKLQN